MTTLCSEKEGECYSICDHCKHYDFDKRWCVLRNEHSDPHEDCGQFYCFAIDKPQ